MFSILPTNGLKYFSLYVSRSSTSCTFPNYCKLSRITSNSKETFYRKPQPNTT